MIGAIAGDIIGSVYEGRKQWMIDRNPDFEPLISPKARFTDDTVLTVAVADYILNSRDLVETLKAYACTYPKAGYGKAFKAWAFTDDELPYNSFGNGSAMRVSPVAYACSTLDDVLRYAKETASATHNHPEGIKGAQAVAAAVFLARTGSTKSEIGQFIEGRFSYCLNSTIERIRWTYSFDSTCQGSVPQAIIAALESTDFESAVRLAVSLGGDCDTLASIAGAIAQGLYGSVPEDIAAAARFRLDDHLRQIVEEFEARFMS